MENEKMIKVRNLANYPVLLFIDEDHLKVKFGAFETKELTESQIRKLYYQDGGARMLTDFLSVQDEKLRADFGIPEDQIEYDWTLENVDEVLNSSDEDALRDALEFGPIAIQELITSRAVGTKIPDMNIRKILKEETGLDINRMITLREDVAAREGAADNATPSRRRKQRQ